ncbi:hypothetical protein [Gracilimonas sp.]|uniref:hypothetical protein n=1 Tax=Gracilimonas sp. TaxID=1974203 RepID=UPI00287239E7|nr:hypothetical protein [Gracilimonas sp.]
MNWHTMRWVALSIGIFLAVMAIWYQDIFTGFLSAFFVFQAVTNTGCMVSQSCGVPQQKEFKNTEESEINYTEVK